MPYQKISGVIFKLLKRKKMLIKKDFILSFKI